jgi:hypothetical protein
MNVTETILTMRRRFDDCSGSSEPAAAVASDIG